MMRNRAAVDGHKLRLAARRAFVDRERGEFLARPRFPRDEDARVGIGYLADGAKELLHRLAGADHFVVAPRRDRRRQFGLAQRHHPERVADEVIDRRVGHRRFHVVETEMTDQAPHVRLMQPLRRGERDPAHLLLAQAGFEAAQVAQRKTRQIDDPGTGGVRLEQTQHFVCRACKHHVPAAALQVRGQRLVVGTRHVQDRAFVLRLRRPHDACHLGRERLALWHGKRGFLCSHEAYFLRSCNRQMRAGRWCNTSQMG